MIIGLELSGLLKTMSVSLSLSLSLSTVNSSAAVRAQECLLHVWLIFFKAGLVLAVVVN